MCFQYYRIIFHWKKWVKIFTFSYGQGQGGWPPPPLRVSLAVKYPYFTSRLTRKLKWRMLHKEGSISKCSLGKKFSIRNASFRLEIRSNGQKCVFFNLYKNKLFNQFHAVKLSLVAVKSTDWNMKLSCFPKVGTTQAVSSPWVRCLATWGAVFLNYSSVLQACMHWVYQNVFRIFQTVHFSAIISLFG